MTSIFRAVAMSAVMAAASWGATVQFSGTLTEASGVYSLLLAPGTTFTGTAQITGSGPDTYVDEPNENGQYSISVGRIDLNIGGLIFLTYDASVSDQFELYTYEFGASPDQVYMTSNITGFGSAVLALFGTDAMLTPPAAVNGEAALSEINWSAFTSGSLNVTVVDQFQPTSESVAGAAEGFGSSVATFSVDSVQAIPEPGTVFGVAAGGLVLWLKRRQSR